MGFLARGTLALAAIVGVAAAAEPRPATTAGAIAISNLDHQLARTETAAERIDLLLARSRFLGDHDALDEAVQLAQSLPANSEGLLSRARTSAAAHRFEQALADLATAAEAGADERSIGLQRASILVATGRAAEALPLLQAQVAAAADFASLSALASAFAELGRYVDADSAYRAALGELRTTSPFPYAWVHFARGVMWSEQAGDPARGEAEYAQALAYLPQFAVANVHKAELELDRDELESAEARIRPIAENVRDPEALALLGEIRHQAGDKAGAQSTFDAANRRYQSLLQRQPLAFADHAAEFYLGPGENPEQAWLWAKRNLDNRATPRAYALAIQAAVASGRCLPIRLKQCTVASDNI